LTEKSWLEPLHKVYNNSVAFFARKDLTCTSELFSMQKYSFALLLGVLLLSACDTEPSNTYRPAPVIGGEQQPAGDVQMMLPEQQTLPANPSTSTALNPEHGQPGHRCDIAVGAPLNGSPAPKEITTQVNTAQPETPATIMQQPAKPAISGDEKLGSKKLNPEHGQPGHDCAVPVGNPLP